MYTIRVIKKYDDEVVLEVNRVTSVEGGVAGTILFVTDEKNYLYPATGEHYFELIKHAETE